MNKVLIDVQYHVEYLNARSFEQAEYYASTRRILARYQLKDRPFDLVLVSDSEAMSFVLDNWQELFAKLPVIFCGIDEDQLAKLSWSRNITGVTKELAYRETAELALRLHPQTEEIIVIEGPPSISGHINQGLPHAALSILDNIRITYWENLSIEELTDRLKALPPDRLILINGTVADRSGHLLSFDATLKQIRAVASAPIYSPWDFFLGKGIVGGKVINAEWQGEMAARAAMKILRGAAPGNLPFVIDGGNRFAFDHNELVRFGIDPTLLPADSLIVNQPPAKELLSKNQIMVIFGIVLLLSAEMLILFFRLKQKHELLKVEKSKRELLFNSIAEGVYGLDLHGNCTFCNTATLKLLGYQDESDLVGRNLHDLIHHTHADGKLYPAEDCKACLAFKHNQEVHLEDEILWRADGTSFPVEYWAYPVRQGSRLVGAVVSFVDITERKQTEEQLREANRELDAFVYTVSHDLRTPISAVIGYSDFIKENHRTELSGEVIELLDSIEKQGHRMAILAEDLLALATAGNLPAPDQAVDANAELGYVLAELKEQIASSGATVVSGSLPTVKVPGTLLVQIFQNLIANALRYAGKEGSPIEVGGNRVGSRVRLYVRDHGQGIPEGERSRIFDVFYRGSTGKNLIGSGVGLATVQKISRLYGGEAWVEETSGGGATFWVEMNGV
jgi:PAS domain S-box-containing protein